HDTSSIYQSDQLFVSYLWAIIGCGTNILDLWSWPSEGSAAFTPSTRGLSPNPSPLLLLRLLWGHRHGPVSRQLTELRHRQGGERMSSGILKRSSTIIINIIMTQFKI
ncbi:hypothetical protein LINPERHAP1_LOCUS25148, partial [Linum perenne]